MDYSAESKKKTDEEEQKYGLLSLPSSQITHWEETHTLILSHPILEPLHAPLSVKDCRVGLSIHGLNACSPHPSAQAPTAPIDINLSNNAAHNKAL